MDTNTELGGFLADNITGAITSATDRDLGALLLAIYVKACADAAGISQGSISGDVVENIRQGVLKRETKTAKNAAVQLALHKAAGGDFCAAGRLCREHLIDGAIASKFIPIGIKRSKQTTEFGRRGAEASKRQGAANRRTVLMTRDEVLANRIKPPSERQLASLISKKAGINENTVRGILRSNKKVD